MDGIRSAQHRHPRTTTPTEHLAVMAELFALLADRSRIALLLQLRSESEVCVTDLAEGVGISESAVSHALRLLRAHGVVETRREGRWVYYSLADEHVRVLLDATVEHLERDHT